MNTKEMIVQVLRNMNEREDAATIADYRSEIVGYLNDGYLQSVTFRMKPLKQTIATSTNGRLAISDIGENFYEISRILDKNDMEVRYSFNYEYIFLPDGEYRIEYVFMPKPLVADGDIPIFSPAYHYILSDYATHRMLLKGSKSRQARGDAFLNSYLNGQLRLVTSKTKSITNKFGGATYG